ncbi:MAG: RluA family pseudouridine synthase [Candidatus Vogelbacteria bacterium]|nr:RluA family pseudouridine synthase [Candidatus Vogelbacteria bacterium]
MDSPTIIYEDEDVLALNKPAGLTVVELAEKYPQVTLAHRLDKETSGVILAAKNETALEYLRQLFRTGGIKKKYLALVYGHPPGGTIDLSIGRSRKDPRRRIAGKGATGKLREAVTEYRVLEELGKYSLLEVKPKTGRTHQIRVHFKALGYPIACDGLYAPGRACPPPLGRQALHAESVEFIDQTGKKRLFRAVLPPDFQEALDNIRRTGV